MMTNNKKTGEIQWSNSIEPGKSSSFDVFEYLQVMVMGQGLGSGTGQVISGLLRWFPPVRWYPKIAGEWLVIPPTGQFMGTLWSFNITMEDQHFQCYNSLEIAIFNSKLFVYQRVTWPPTHTCPAVQLSSLGPPARWDPYRAERLGRTYPNRAGGTMPPAWLN